MQVLIEVLSVHALLCEIEESEFWCVVYVATALLQTYQFENFLSSSFLLVKFFSTACHFLSEFLSITLVKICF
jgi:hypothetical protein